MITITTILYFIVLITTGLTAYALWWVFECLNSYEKWIKDQPETMSPEDLAHNIKLIAYAEAKKVLNASKKAPKVPAKKKTK